MSVPVQNIYYLLCYAWKYLAAKDSIAIGAIAGNRVENLLGKVLQVGVGHLLRSGLDRGYVAIQEDGRQLRGKLLVIQTVQRLLLQQGRVACEHDEFIHDVPHNRVIKAAMRALMALPSLDPEIRIALRSHCQRFGDVADVELVAASFRQVQLHRNLARYAFLVNIAKLVSTSFVPEPGTGVRRFHPFTASDQEMGNLFQAFLYQFLRREQNRLIVAAPKVAWDLDASASSDEGWLPEMKTDIVLSDSSRRVVIEAKCVTNAYQQHENGRKKLVSAHLYQLMSYLVHLSATDGPKPVGMLLYAGLGPGERLEYRLAGHTVLVRGLDLNREWPEIHSNLLALLGDVA